MWRDLRVFESFRVAFKLANDWILSSGVKYLNCWLLVVQRFKWAEQVAPMEGRIAFMKQLPAAVKLIQFKTWTNKIDVRIDFWMLFCPSTSMVPECWRTLASQVMVYITTWLVDNPWRELEPRAFVGRRRHCTGCQRIQCDVTPKAVRLLETPVQILFQKVKNAWWANFMVDDVPAWYLRVKSLTSLSFLGGEGDWINLTQGVVRNWHWRHTAKLV